MAYSEILGCHDDNKINNETYYQEPQAVEH